MQLSIKRRPAAVARQLAGRRLRRPELKPVAIVAEQPFAPDTS